MGLATRKPDFAWCEPQKVSENDQEIPQSHTEYNPCQHREEEPQDIYSNNTSVRL